MNKPIETGPSDESLAEMLCASMEKPDAAFQQTLTDAVLAEVRRERRARRIIRVRWAFASVAAAAVIVAIGVLTIRPSRPVAPEGTAAVESAYGCFRLSNGVPAREMLRSALVYSSQWIEVLSGSEAVISLPDRSTATARAHTRAQFSHGDEGSRIRLEKGAIEIQAAKQASGKALTIETPAALVTVLGTELNVRVVRKPDGSRQTRVAVASGRVAMRSGGETIQLLPNTEGIADESVAPVRLSLTAEVNELNRLKSLTGRLAAKSGARAGQPAIVDFLGDATATVWTAVSIKNDTGAPLTGHTLSLPVETWRVRAYTEEGAPIPANRDAAELQLDLSGHPLDAGKTAKIILHVAGMHGLFKKPGDSGFTFSASKGPGDVLTILQFRLPEEAVIENVSPAPIETRLELNRRVITVAANCDDLKPLKSLSEPVN